ncbi:MAG: SPOR domain-containing protein [Pseudomonadota bacterium]|nr:SPOR domain-containing protein [Pseudomonadota bacterium]
MKERKNIRFREMRLGKIGLLVLVAGMGVLVALAFILGVQVGRDIDAYPRKIARDIPGRIAAGIGSFFAKKAPEGKGADSESETTNLTFYDILAKKRGDGDSGHFVEEKKEAPASSAAVIMAPGPPPPPPKAEGEGEGASPPPLAPGTVAPSPTTSPARASRTSPAATPTAAPAPPPMTLSKTSPANSSRTSSPSSPAAGKDSAPVPSPASRVAPPASLPGSPPAPKTGTFSVQVASYHELDKARQLQEKLRDLGFPAEIVAADVPGRGAWRRVVVPGYQTRAMAEKAAGEMAGKVRGLNCVIRRN